MKRLIILLILMTVVVISGCINQKKYVCPDGSVVSDPTLCPKTTITITTTTTIKSICGDGICQSDENCTSCGNDCGYCKLTITNAKCEGMGEGRYRISYTLVNNNNFLVTFKDQVFYNFSYAENCTIKSANKCEPKFGDVCADGDFSFKPQESKEYSYIEVGLGGKGTTIAGPLSVEIRVGKSTTSQTYQYSNTVTVNC